LEGALNTLLQITDKSGNLRKDLKHDIVKSVSTLRNVFINLMNRGEQQNKETNLLRVEIKRGRGLGIAGRAIPSRDGNRANSRG
jgi:hypothetical protein